MGKGGGGGGGPQVSTAYQTNLPEYAKPYVMNMLGAAQNQLFTTTPGTDGGPGEITGFKPYTPYSTNPTDYFAGPSNLQRNVYSEAGQMQTPGQFGFASGLGGLAGMGQMGAGQQFARQATNPYAVQQYMSPFMQNVVDTQKTAALRDFQIAQPTRQAQATLRGAFGGSRSAIENAEAQRSLMSQLQGIQATGTQKAFEDAQKQQQFGANLGLQGLQGASQTAGMLGQLGGAQQQSDLARMGFQQQTGKDQQAFQQNIINQQIQDFATAQQYPYMQLSTMSNLLRGLPMQAMSTQQYQAQPSTSQQLLGLAGTGASLYGAMGRKEGGSIKEYAAGGGIRASLENKIDDIADAGGAKGLQSLLAQTKSPQAKQMIMDRMREEGIAAAPTGKLGTNMAGGGIIAFEGGGGVGTFDGMGSDDMSMDQLRVDEAKLKKDLMQYNFLKDASPVAAERFLENNPAVRSRITPAAAPAAAPVVANNRDNVPPAAPAVAVNTDTANTAKLTGLDAVLEDRRRRLGFDGDGEKNQAFMKALEERQAGMGKQREGDRYLRAAEAFAKFGSTAGPIGVAASQALGGFAKGEAAARKDEDKMQLEGMKMQADLEKARRAEARGDLDAAEKFYGSAEDRKNRLETANIGAAASGSTPRFEQQAIERIMKEKGVDYSTALREVRGAGKADTIDSNIAAKAYEAAQTSIAAGGPNSKKYKELMKKDPAEAQRFLNDIAQQQIMGIRNAMGLSGGGGGGGGNVDSSNPLLKR